MNLTSTTGCIQKSSPAKSNPESNKVSRLHARVAMWHSSSAAAPRLGNVPQSLCMEDTRGSEQPHWPTALQGAPTGPGIRLAAGRSYGAPRGVRGRFPLRHREERCGSACAVSMRRLAGSLISLMSAVSFSSSSQGQPAPDADPKLLRNFLRKRSQA